VVRPAQVPRLVGLAIEDAQALAATLPLRVNVVTETAEFGLTRTVVVSQSPLADVQIDLGGAVAVGVRKPMATQVIPLGALGRLTDEISPVLASVGWTIVIREEISTQPERTILRSDPPLGSSLPLTGTVTLFVSNGGRKEVNATWSDGITLEAIKFDRAGYAPGQTMLIDARWKASNRPRRSYKVGVYLLDNNQYLAYAQASDREPAHRGVGIPTNLWLPGQIIEDQYRVQLPTGLPAGRYRLAIALYEFDYRDPVTSVGSAVAAELNSLIVTPIDVR
jgi:hypothetical protein